MPSLPISHMNIGLTSIEPNSAQLTWMPGTASLRIQRKGLPDFLVRVDREVDHISYTNNSTPAISIRLLPCRPHQCPSKWECNFGRGSEFRHTVTIQLDSAGMGHSAKYAGLLRWVNGATSPTFITELSNEAMQTILDCHVLPWVLQATRDMTAESSQAGTSTEGAGSLAADKSAQDGNRSKRRKADLSSQAGPSTEGAGRLTGEAPDSDSSKRRKTVGVSSKVSITGRSKQGGPGPEVAGEMEVEQAQVASSAKPKQIRRVTLIDNDEVEYVSQIKCDARRITKIEPGPLPSPPKDDYSTWRMGEDIVRRLDRGEDLSGDLVDFGMCVVRDLLHENHPELSELVGIFQAEVLGYWADLTNATQEQRYLRVETMIKFNIFKKRFLVMPVHMRSSHHWCLAIVKAPANALDQDGDKTAIYFLDSIRTTVNKHTLDNIKHLLYYEAKLRYKQVLHLDRFKIYLPHVPQQPNHCDCGLYAIHFAHMFASNPDFYSDLIENPNVNVIDIERSHSVITQNTVGVWNASDIGNLRLELKQLILAYGAIDEKLEVWFQKVIERTPGYKAKK